MKKIYCLTLSFLLCSSSLLWSQANETNYYYNRGLDLFEKGDLQGAVLYFNEAIRLDPNSSKSHNARGLAREELRNISGALADYSHAISLARNEPAPYFNRAMLRARQEDRTKGLEDAKTYLRLTNGQATIQIQKNYDQLFKEFPTLKPKTTPREINNDSKIETAKSQGDPFQWMTLLKEKNQNTRIIAALRLGWIGEEALTSIPLLQKMSQTDNNLLAREIANEVFQKLNPPLEIQELLKELYSTQAQFAFQRWYQFNETQKKQMIPFLLVMLQEKNPEVRQRAAELLGQLEEYSTELRSILKHLLLTQQVQNNQQSEKYLYSLLEAIQKADMNQEKLIPHKSESNTFQQAPRKKEAESFYRKGIAYGKEKNFLEGIKELSLAIYLAPQNAKYYYARGFLAYKIQQYTSAKTDFSQAITLKPDFFKAIAYRGRCFSKLKNYQTEALQDFDQALLLNPKEALLYYERGLIRVERGEIERAKTDFREFLSQTKNQKEKRLQNARKKIIEQFPELNQTETSVTTPPTKKENYLNTIKKFLNQFPKKKKKETIEPVATAEEYLEAASKKVKAGDFLAAIRDYDQAIQLNPKLAEAYNFRGFAKAKLGDLKQSILDYTEAIGLNPQFSEAYYHRGVALSDLGKLEEAEQDYSRAIQLNPKMIEVYNARGYLKSQQGKFENAIKDYSKAIELEPQNIHAYLMRGMANAQQGKPNKAIQDYEEAIRLDPKFAYAYFYRGDIKARLGQMENAKKDFRTFLDLTQNQPTPTMEKMREDLLKQFPDLKE